MTNIYIYTYICGRFILEQFSCNEKLVCSHFGYSIPLKKIYEEKKESKDEHRGQIPPAVNPEEKMIVTI